MCIHTYGLHRGWLAAFAAIGILLVRPVFAQVDESSPSTSDESGEATNDFVGYENVIELPADPPPEAKLVRDSPVGLEEIVVTATKRARLEAEVPGTVSVVRGEDLEKMGAIDMESFLKLSPGVSLNKNGEGKNAPSIRGITTNAAVQNTQMTTGFYIDDIPFTDPYIPGGTPDLVPFDLDRVEVLKGPQGTLYGSSSLGGAVRYLTTDPEIFTWQSKVMLSGTMIEGDMQADSEPAGALMVNVPVGETAAFRVMASHRENPGYVDNLSANQGVLNANSSRSSHGRVKWLWQPNDRWKTKFSFLRQSSEADDSGFTDSPDQLQRENTPTKGPSRFDFGIENLVVGYSFDWSELLSSTTHLTKHRKETIDASRGFATNGVGLDQQGSIPVQQMSNFDSDAISQEFRLTSVDDGSPWNWMAGAWFLSHKQDVPQDYPNPVVAAVDGAPLLNPGALATLPVLGTILRLPVELLQSPELSLLNGQFNSVGTEIALFGEVGRVFFDDWELVVGGRLFQTSLDADITTAGILNAAVAGSLSSARSLQVKEKGFNPKVSLRYTIDDGLSVYGLVSKGFQFGGVQLLAPPGASVLSGGVDIPESYDSSELWNYELGARSEWFGRRLTVDATLFHAVWSNLQISQDAGSGLISYVDNVGKAHSSGAELAVRARPIAPLILSTSMAYIDARTDVSFESSSGEVPKDTRLPATPKFQAATVATYSQPIGTWTTSLSVSHSYVGQSFNNLQGTIALGSYSTWDLDIHLLREDLPFVPDIGISINNVLDERAVVGGNGSESTSYRDYFLIRPRTISVNLNMQFF